MKKLKFVIPLLVLFSLLIIPSIGLAQKSIISELKWDLKTVIKFLQTLVNWLGIIAGLIAVVFVVIGGIRYIAASGNPEAATAAKTSVINALIGVVIVAAAYGIVTLVLSLIPK